MSAVQRVREYLRRYPGLEDLGVDCLPGNVGGFSLDPVAGEQVQGTYLDGTQRCQVRFLLRSRRGYGADIQAQEETYSWFDGFARWLEAQNARRVLPELDPGARAVRLLPQEPAAVETIGDDGLCAYQMTLGLEYLREAAEP